MIKNWLFNLSLWLTAKFVNKVKLHYCTYTVTPGRLPHQQESTHAAWRKRALEAYNRDMLEGAKCE